MIDVFEFENIENFLKPVKYIKNATEYGAKIMASERDFSVPYERYLVILVYPESTVELIEFGFGELEPFFRVTKMSLKMLESAVSSYAVGMI